MKEKTRTAYSVLIKSKDCEVCLFDQAYDAPVICKHCTKDKPRFELRKDLARIRTALHNASHMTG